MNKPYLHTTSNETGKHSKKRFLQLADRHIEAFNVCRPNPQVVFHVWYARKRVFIVGGVGDIGEHGQDLYYVSEKPFSSSIDRILSTYSIMRLTNLPSLSGPIIDEELKSLYFRKYSDPKGHPASSL